MMGGATSKTSLILTPGVFGAVIGMVESSSLTQLEDMVVGRPRGNVEVAVDGTEAGCCGREMIGAGSHSGDGVAALRVRRDRLIEGRRRACVVNCRARYRAVIGVFQHPAADGDALFRAAASAEHGVA